MANKDPANIVVRPATTADLDALQHTFAASFHPVSPFMVQVFPSTPRIREWWRVAHAWALNDPCTTLTVACSGDSSNSNNSNTPNPNAGSDILGLVRYSITSFPTPSSVDAGAWARLPLTPDHDAALYAGMVDYMAAQRRQHMGTARHLLVELLCVVHGAQGRGVGARLLRGACDAADAERVPCFVEANAAAAPFYRHAGGFEVRAELEMPGGHAYRELILVREPRERADAGARAAAAEAA
jgi:GNAT superfamily N-acetyltransferase